MRYAALWRRFIVRTIRGLISARAICQTLASISRPRATSHSSPVLGTLRAHSGSNRRYSTIWLIIFKTRGISGRQTNGGLAMQGHKVVSKDQWVSARKQLLAKEKEFTRLRDQLSQQRRELPWERVDKQYIFEGPNGKETLADLFAGRSQLVVY